MPRKQATQHAITNTMSRWVWTAPAKFSLLTIGLTIILFIIIGLVGSAMTTPGMPMIVPPYVRWIAWILMAAVLIFGVIKLVKWTPADKLDRHSFVAARVVYVILSVICGAILAVMLLSHFNFSLFVMKMLYTTPTALIVVYILAALLIMGYLIGLCINLSWIAMFRRAQKMGVANHKIWLMFPFGWNIFNMPMLFLPSDVRESNVIPVRAKWLANITDWAFGNIWNAIVLFVLLPVAIGIALNPTSIIGTIVIPLLPAVIFFGLWWIVGTKKMNVRGWFANLAIILNILAILTFVGVGVFGFHHTTNIPSPAEQVQITDVK